MADKLTELKLRLSVDRKIKGLKEAKSKLKKELGSHSVSVKLNTKRAVDSLKKLSTQSKKTTATFSKTFNTQSNQRIKRTGTTIRKTSNDLKGFAKSTQLAGKRYAAFLSSAGTSVLVFRKLSRELKNIIDFEMSLVKVAQVSDVSLFSPCMLETDREKPCLASV